MRLPQVVGLIEISVTSDFFVFIRETWTDDCASTITVVNEWLAVGERRAIENSFEQHQSKSSRLERKRRARERSCSRFLLPFHSHAYRICLRRSLPIAGLHHWFASYVLVHELVVNRLLRTNDEPICDQPLHTLSLSLHTRILTSE